MRSTKLEMHSTRSQDNETPCEMFQYIPKKTATFFTSKDWRIRHRDSSHIFAKSETLDIQKEKQNPEQNIWHSSKRN
jgi:hypothetical protein